MKTRIRYRRSFGRIAFFREWMAGRALRRHSLDFGTSKPMVSIIGDVVSDGIRAEGVFEREILEFLRDRLLDLDASKSQIAIDVGANIGNHSLFLSDIFARVIAFEPNPLARSIFQLNLELNGVTNVEVRDVGLSDKPGNATLAFDHGNLGGASALGIRSGTGGSSEIELVVGDEAIDPSTPVALLKVDVEGAEEEALRGLERTIRSHRPIVMIEQWANAIDPATGTSPSVSFLRSLGYSAWELTEARAFRGRRGKISSLLMGQTNYVLRQIDRLAQRDYWALFFLPSER